MADESEFTGADDVFVTVCQQWMDRMELQGCEVHIDLMPAHTMGTSAADCDYSVTRDRAFVRIVSPANLEPHERDLEYHIVHELVHILVDRATLGKSKKLGKVREELLVHRIASALLESGRIVEDWSIWSGLGESE